MSEKKSIIKGIYNWTFLAIVIVAIVLINIISSFVNSRIDITKDQRFSLSKGTVDFLSNEKSFTNRLNIKIYLEGNLPAELKNFRNAIEDKLKEFKKVAGNRIEYQFINPMTGTEEEQKELHISLYNKGKGIMPMDIEYTQDASINQLLMWPGANIEYEGETVNTLQFLPGTPPGTPYQLTEISEMIENSINNLEYMLISSIRRSTQKRKPRIAFLQGHGESRFSQTQRVRALISPYFSLADIKINDSIEALDNVDGLIISNPKTVFSDKDLYVIDQFLLKGGRLMCFIDALKIDEHTLNAKGTTHTIRYNNRLDKMLFDYGLKINDNYVLDVQCAPKSVPLAKQSSIPWFYHVLATPTKHPIARNIESVSLKYVSEIQFVGSSKTNVKSSILTSSSNSAKSGMAPMVSLGIALNFGKNPELVPNPTNIANRICLAGLVEGKFNSHYKNRIVDEFSKNPLSKYKESSTKEGKVLLVGNGRFIENKYDSMPSKDGKNMMYRPQQINDLRYDPEIRVPHSFGNQEFFQNMVDYMLGDNTVIDIRSRQIDVHGIDKEKIKEGATFYKIINLIVPCGIILLLAFSMQLIRKRKYSQL